MSLSDALSSFHLDFLCQQVMSGAKGPKFRYQEFRGDDPQTQCLILSFPFLTVQIM